MTTTSIEQTVEQALQANGLSGYQSQARPVVDALVRRETNIVENLIGTVVEKGLPREEAVRLFQGAGMALPQAITQDTGFPQSGSQAQPVQAQATQQPLDTVTRIQMLEQFAASQGYKPEENYQR